MTRSLAIRCLSACDQIEQLLQEDDVEAAVEIGRQILQEYTDELNQFTLLAAVNACRLLAERVLNEEDYES